MKSFLFLILLLTSKAFSQNIIFVGNNAYQSTQSWFFEGNGDQFEYYAKDAVIKVGKRGQSGIFSISTKVYNSSFGIKGSIRIYLDDLTTIVLNKIVARDFVDQNYTVIYTISTSDLNKLKYSNINTIRFNSGLAGQLKGSTVSNRYDANPDPIIYDERHWNTSSEILNLFGN